MGQPSLDRDVHGQEVSFGYYSTLEGQSSPGANRPNPNREQAGSAPTSEGRSPDPDVATMDGNEPRTPRRKPSPAVGGYEILEELGRGGMGVVYKARQTRLKRMCALKMILAGAHADAIASLRFLSEAEAIARLHHPNVVQIHHVGEADGLPFFELEYVDGGSLDRRLDGTPWSARAAASLVVALADGVAEAHRLGIVHRDLKPGNVLIARDGTPKIADFGLAKSLLGESGLTATESIMGSPSYMAPEQAEGKAKEVGPLADVYALGAILYELLVGRPPFRGATVLDTIGQVKSAEPVPPSRLVPGLPRDVETVTLKCLQKDPSRRYASAEALGDDLRRFLDDRPIAARPAGRVERVARWCRRNRAVSALLALAATLLVLVAVVSLVGYASERNARREAVGNLYHALVGEARALRIARAGGYRSQVFDRLARAMRLATPGRDPTDLRREAAATLGDFVGLEPLTIRDLEPPTNSRDRDRRLALDPHSIWIAVGRRDGSVRLFDRASGRELGQIPGLASSVTALGTSSDGRRLLVGHQDGTIQVVQDPASALRRTLSTVKAEGMILAFDPTDGRRALVKTASPRQIVVRDLDPPGATTVSLAVDDDNRTDLAGSLAFNLEYPLNMAISPDGRHAATGVKATDSDGRTSWEIFLWNIQTGRLIRRAPSPFGNIYQIAFSPDGARLAVGCDMRFAVLDTSDLHPRLTAGEDSANAISFSPDGRTLVVGTITRQIKLWSMTSNRELAVLKHSGGGNSLSQVVISADGRTLASLSQESVQVWDLAGAAERLVLAGNAEGIPGMAFSPDGAMLASSSNDRTVQLWDPATGQHLRTLEGYAGGVQDCAFSPDGSLLATGSESLLRIWETRHWAIAFSDNDPTEPYISRLVFTRAGKDGPGLLATSGAALRIWRVEREGEADRIALRSLVKRPGPDDRGGVCVAISPDGARAAYIEARVRVKVWDFARKQELAFSGPELRLGWHGLAFRSPTELVYISRDGVAMIWDVVADRQVRTIGRAGTFEGFHVAASPDGRWLAAEATPASAAVVDLERGEVTFLFREERCPIWSLAWSPDARRLALGLSDGGLIVWDLDLVRTRLVEVGLPRD